MNPTQPAITPVCRNCGKPGDHRNYFQSPNDYTCAPEPPPVSGKPCPKCGKSHDGPFHTCTGTLAEGEEVEQFLREYAEGKHPLSAEDEAALESVKPKLIETLRELRKPTPTPAERATPETPEALHARLKDALDQLVAEKPDYMVEVESCDKWIKWCKDNGNDMYGVNFYEGRQSGIIAGNIIHSRIIEDLERDRDSLRDETEAYLTELAHKNLAIAELRAEVERLKGERDAISAKYYDLIYAVGTVWDGETRHETALRYIKEAEHTDETPQQEAR